MRMGAVMKKYLPLLVFRRVISISRPEILPDTETARHEGYVPLTIPMVVNTFCTIKN
jgi:hypothetical protein